VARLAWQRSERRVLPKKRSLARSVAILLAVLLLGTCAPSPVFRAWVTGMCALSNWAVSATLFENNVALTFSPAPAELPRQAQDQVHTDTILELQPEGKPVARMGLSLRRDIYLPSVVFAALVLAVPLPFRRRLLGLVLSSGVTLAVGVLSLWALIEFLVATQFPELSAASDFSKAVLTFLFECWLTPPGNRIIAPLMLSAVWLVLHYETAARRLTGATPRPDLNRKMQSAQS
jgi:hypothetical protein